MWLQFTRDPDASVGCRPVILSSGISLQMFPFLGVQFMRGDSVHHSVHVCVLTVCVRWWRTVVHPVTDTVDLGLSFKVLTAEFDTE